MRIKLSRRFNLYVGGILFIGMSAFVYHNTISNERLLQQIGNNEAQRLARTSFDQLYTSMQLGGGRIENQRIVDKIRAIIGVDEMRIVHGRALDKQYGVEESELPRDEYDRAALSGNTTSIIESAKGARAARHVMPVFITADCRRCHNAGAGEVAGAISVTISLKKYDSVIAGHTMNFLFWSVFILGFTSLAVMLSVRSRFLKPIEKLKEGAQALARWELTHRVNLKTNDELEDLSSAFDDMAENLMEATKELKYTNKKYLKLVEMALDAILLKDIETDMYVDANPAAAALAGYSREEFLNLCTEDLFKSGIIGRYKESYKRWIYDGKGYLHGGVITGKGGALVPVEIAASVIDIDGRKFMQEIWRDISERKGLEDTLRRYVNDLEETVRERTGDLNRTLREREEAYGKLQASEQKLIQSAKLISLGEMGAGIAHELNSPLAGVLSITEVLLGRVGRNDANYYLLEKIKDASVRSKHIIQDMLSYARPFKGEFVRVNINDIVRGTLNLFASEIKTSSIDIALGLDDGLPDVMGNKGQLMEVLLNLIKNARDAMGGKGGISVNSRLRLSDGKSGRGAPPMISVEIRDTGPGIPPEIKDRIFDPFFSTKERGGGMNIGLGLSITQSIVKEHGGFVEVDSEPGKGAAFRIIIPAADPAGTAIGPPPPASGTRGLNPFKGQAETNATEASHA
ncbi:MAG: PAS domain S-box protein [Deltaproteobacteria bacterium]|nr:PAS domain S-box protein [Deltaproteobacteria bacterium]